MKWINCSDKLPEPAQRVLAVFPTGYSDVRRISLVAYIPTMTIKAEDFWSDDECDCTEYNEDEDCYYVEAGWYEQSYESETDWKLTCEVTHWMPLPELPVWEDKSE